MIADSVKSRPAFSGVWQIIRYNWSQYVAACAVICTGLIIAGLVPMSEWTKLIIFIGCAGAAYFVASSIVVSWIVYDKSALAQQGWITELGETGPGNWLVLHTGIDEASSCLRTHFDLNNGTVYDIYDAELMTEPSIRRARSISANKQDSLHVNWRNLPADNEQFNTVFMIMSVHEFRQFEALAMMFREAHRVLRSGGRVLLVEHLRDAANFAAFGPGFLHFWSRSSWLAIADQAGLVIFSERKITPWVHVFLFEKPK